MSYGVKKGEKGRIVSMPVGESRTKGSFKDMCDINMIVKKAQAGGDISHLNRMRALYGDFSNVPDYKGACEIVQNANNAFSQLDADIRERFGNNPGLFLDFCSKQENHDEMEKLGLLEPKANTAAKPSVEPPAPKAVSPEVK